MKMIGRKKMTRGIEPVVIDENRVVCPKCRKVFLTMDYGTAMEYYNLNFDYCRRKSTVSRAKTTEKNKIKIPPEQIDLL